MGKVAIIGAGVIGLSYAELFAENGWDVSIYDINPDAVPEDSRWSRMHSIADAVTGADLVQENGPENLQIKQSLLAQIAEAAGDDTIIASSTSSLMPSVLADGNARADQILVAHPFNPPRLIPLVEIVPSPTTRPELTERAVAVYREIGQHPVHLAKEIPGFVGNRLQRAVSREAMHLVKEGVVTPGQLDEVMKNSLGLRWSVTGVFEANHLGGGAEGIRQLLLGHVGRSMNDVILGEPKLTRAWIEELCDTVEQTYGGSETYPERAERRDRLTSAVRDTVARETEGE